MKSIKLTIISLLFLISQVCVSQTITEPDGFKWIKFVEHGFMGVKSDKGKILVPADYIDCFTEWGYLIGKDRKGCFAVYDRTGKNIVEPGRYTHITYFDDIFVVIGRNGYGAISHDGSVLLKDTYDAISLYGENSNDSFFIINLGGYNGIARLDGKVIIPPNKYHEVFRIGDHTSGHYSFMVYTPDGNESGICDLNGKEIIRTKYYQTFGPTDVPMTYYNIYTGSSLGKIDLKGNVIEQPNPKLTYTPVTVDNKVFQMVFNENNKYGIVDSSNNVIIPVKYDCLFVKDSSKNFIVWKGIYMGLYNSEGKCIISTDDKYISIAELESTITATTENNTATIYSKEGKLIAKTEHRNANLNIAIFPDGQMDTTVAYNDNRYWGIMKLDGTRLVKPIYEDFNMLCSHAGTYFYAFRNNKVGICNYHTGQELIPPVYTDIKIGGNKEHPFFFLSNGGKYGVANIDGSIIIPSETFNRIDFNEKNLTFTAFEGKRICKFNFKGILLEDTQAEADRDNYISLADSEFEKGNYSKAAKYYESAINIRPSASLYFNRGASYYNNDLYKNAIDDFRRCLNSDPSQNLIDRCRDLIRKSQMYLEEKREQRRQMACNIIGLIFSTASAVVQYSIDHHNGTSYIDNSYYYSGNTYSNSRSESQVLQDFTQGANQILAQTITEFNNKEIQEFNEFCKYNKHSNGRDYTYEEWNALRGQAIQNLKDQGYDIIAEQREINRQNNEDWRKSLDEERTERLDRIKEYNAMKYGTTSSGSTQSSNHSTSTSSKSSSIQPKSTNSNSVNTQSQENSTVNKQKEYDSHEQFKNGNINASSSDYQYIKKVTLYRQEGSSYKVSRSDVELYKKGAQQYIKIGNSYYLASLAASSTQYQKKISYGGMPLYFND